MRKKLLLVSTAVLLGPAAGPTLVMAQLHVPRPLEARRVAVTPVLGYLAPFTVAFNETLNVQGVQVGRRIENRVVGALSLGGAAEVEVFGPLGVVASVLRSEHETLRSSVVSAPGSPSERFSGSTLWVASGGVSLRLLERDTRMQMTPATASVSLGPTLIRETPRSGSAESINHWAITVGANGYAAVGAEGRLALFFSIQDHMTLWNATEYERRTEREYRENFDLDVNSELAFDMSHLVMLRVGLALLVF